MTPESGTSIFGEVNTSALWAWDSRDERRSSAPGLDLAGGQVVFVFVVDGNVSVNGAGRGRETLGAGCLAVAGTGDSAVGLRFEGATEVVLVGLNRELLEGMLEPFRPGLSDEVRDLVFSSNAGVAPVQPFSEAVGTRLIPAFREPGVSGPALSFWFESQVREMISLVCFKPLPGTAEFFCSRQKRLALDRVARVKALLEARVGQSLDLQGLAREVGCSPFYLSRTFSSTTGMTISQYMRRLRIETAADLLASGRFSVSEVAVEVGYQSLSHFSKAFQQIKGCLPSKYEAA